MHPPRDYHPLPESVDLLVAFAHPDDEIAWFGGLIPDAVAAGLRVLAVCMTRGDGGGNAEVRDAELRESLWTCGLRHAPVFGDFADCGFIAPGRFQPVEWVWERWGGRATASAWMAGLYRRFQPTTVATHDPLTGDYGHPNHMAVGQACVDAFDHDPESPHAPRDLYLCSRKPGILRFDWQRPLAAFAGATASMVGNRALACHRSQSASTSTIKDTLGFVLHRSRADGPPHRKDPFARLTRRDSVRESPAPVREPAA